MMLSELLRMSLDLYLKHGDHPVKVDLLTENQSNLVEITDITFIKNSAKGGPPVYYVDTEIEDLKKFKNSLK